jgi:hypothetical protein
MSCKPTVDWSADDEVDDEDYFKKPLPFALSHAGGGGSGGASGDVSGGGSRPYPFRSVTDAGGDASALQKKAQQPAKQHHAQPSSFRIVSEPAPLPIAQLVSTSSSVASSAESSASNRPHHQHHAAANARDDHRHRDAEKHSHTGRSNSNSFGPASLTASGHRGGERGGAGRDRGADAAASAGAAPTLATVLLNASCADCPEYFESSCRRVRAA